MQRFVQKPAMPSSVNGSAILKNVLAARGIREQAHADTFLYPSLSHLYDPFSLHDMDKAVKRIREAIACQESIVIYGDYDVDGVTATAALTSYLRMQGALVSYFIPSRHDEGYGLNEAAVRRLAGIHTLLITVDCGITSVLEIALASTLGLDVILTDHHQPLAVLPTCVALVNPILGGPFARLCGAGVVGKLVQALGGLEALLEVIDLVAMGTVADMVPLLDENRVLVKYGLERLNDRRRVGIRALSQVAGMGEKAITAGHIGFQLGPRINAGGRMGGAMRCVELLLTDDQEEAQEIAGQLQDENAHRQRVEQGIIEEALQAFLLQDLTQKRILIAQGDWNPGVVGLAASRIVERFHYPVILLCRQGEMLTGSGRSIEGINLHHALMSISDIFSRFGGHEAAAGMTLPADRYDEFAQRLHDALSDVSRKTYIPTLHYDCDLPLEDATEQLARDLLLLQPTGFGNPSPVFRLADVFAITPKAVGREGAHLKLKLSDGHIVREGIAFGMGDLAAKLDGKHEVLCALGMNEYNGGVSVQCEVKAVRRIEDAQDFLAACKRTWEKDLLQTLRYAYHSRQAQHPAALHVQNAQEALKEASQSLQGTLVICKTPQGLARALTSGLPFARSVPNDPRAFSTIVFCPASLKDCGPYHRVLLMEGDWGDACAIRRNLPEAQLMDVCDDDLMRETLPIRIRLCPSKEALRSLYTLLRQRGKHLPSYGDFDTLARDFACAIDGDALTLLAGLHILQEIGLVQMDSSTLRLAEMKKCDPDDSPLMRTLQLLLLKPQGNTAYEQRM